MGGLRTAHRGGISRRLIRQTEPMSLVVPPYPPPRYSKDEPEVSAWLKLSDEPPDYETYGVKYHYLANQQATGGDYGLYRIDIAPAGGGPGPHFHRAMSEAFFVLSGTMKLYDGNDWVDSHQGRLLLRPARRHPRVPQRGRRTGVGPDAVRTRCAAGGLLRRVFSAGRHDRRRTPGVVHPPRQLLGAVDVGFSPIAQSSDGPACSSRRG
jgi:mannose-6-phosphate isomerase-like protein (cupin superfamily)